MLTNTKRKASLSTHCSFGPRFQVGSHMFWFGHMTPVCCVSVSTPSKTSVGLKKCWQAWWSHLSRCFLALFACFGNWFPRTMTNCSYLLKHMALRWCLIAFSHLCEGASKTGGLSCFVPCFSRTGCHSSLLIRWGVSLPVLAEAAPPHVSLTWITLSSPLHRGLLCTYCQRTSCSTSGSCHAAVTGVISPWCILHHANVHPGSISLFIVSWWLMAPFLVFWGLVQFCLCFCWVVLLLPVSTVTNTATQHMWSRNLLTQKLLCSVNKTQVGVCFQKDSFIRPSTLNISRSAWQDDKFPLALCVGHEIKRCLGWS